MGEERRADTARVTAANEDPARRRDRGEDDERDHHAGDAERRLASRQLRGKGEPKVGFTEGHDSERLFAGVGDQDQLGRAIREILDGGGDPSTLAVKVANADFALREEVAKRLADVAKVAPGTDVLQIADLVGIGAADKLRAALAARPPPAESALRAHLLELPAGKRIALLDAATLAALKQAYGSPAGVVPGIEELGADVVKHRELLAWYLTSAPARSIALAMMRGGRRDDQIAELAAAMNAIGRDAWRWAFEVNEGIAALAGYDAANQFATGTEHQDVRDHLLAVAPKVWALHGRGKGPKDGKALQALVPDGAVDVDAVIAAVQEARTFAGNELRVLARSPYRERLIGAASFEQLELLFEAIIQEAPYLSLDWFVDSPHATPARIRAAIAPWSDSWIEPSLVERPKTLAALMARFPSAGPVELFGTRAALFHRLALTRPAIRKWCTQGADARELLALVTQDLARVTAMWDGIIADGVSPDWVRRLGTGAGSDAKLRVLALNCPDRAAASWIRVHLLGDKLVEEHASSTPDPIAKVALEGDARARLDEGLASPETQDLGHRTSELSDAELAKLRADPGRLAQLLPSLRDPWLVRALLRIGPPLPIVLAHAELDDEGLPAYMRTRPGSELIDAVANDDIVARIARRVTAPFVVLPQLREPAVMAAMIARPGALGWILRTTDARHALSLLGDPAVAPAAGKQFTKQHLPLVPDMVLSREEGAALKRIAAAIPDKGLAADLRGRKLDPEDVAEEESEGKEGGGKAPAKAQRGSFERRDVQLRHAELEAALEHRDLAHALEVVLVEPAAVASVLAVCRERAGTATEVLTKPEHGELVDRLRRVLAMSPLGVFPSVPYYAYFHTPEARRWLFAHEPPDTLLLELSREQALARLVLEKLDLEDAGLLAWFERMPKGTALTAGERKRIRQMFDDTRSARAARTLFGIRFNTKIDRSFTKAELVRFWDLLDRVPDAHVEQGSIHKIYESATLGYAGVFGGGHFGLKEGIFQGDKDTTMFNEALELTREQLMAAYGYDDAQLEARIASGEIKRQGKHYVVQPQKTSLLENTVLHEIGHAVDEMLGEHTELVFGLAGWRQYGEADIDQLAADLGGWDRVTPDDRARIRDAWVVWLNASTSYVATGLEAFVPDSHPALSSKYKGVGIVDLARTKKPVGYDLPPRNGHYTAVSHKYQKLYRVPERTRHAGPSRYGMTAPQEFFAECYAEYYRLYTGPGTEDKKGGRLAGWIKTWFDQNVDTLKLNPSRKD